MVTSSNWNQLPEKYELWNSVYRFHLRWAHRGIFGKPLKVHVERVGNDGRKVIDAIHVEVNQNTCHFGGDPKANGLRKTKGQRNSKLSAVTNGKGKVLKFDLMTGNRGDITAAIMMFGDVKGHVL